MTNTQLYLAIGLPILVSILNTALLILYINAKVETLTQMILRVEGVLDARLKHVEDKLEIRP
jgi:hypothetical protein